MQVVGLLAFYIIYGLIYIRCMGVDAWKQYGCKFQFPPSASGGDDKGALLKEGVPKSDVES